jgi:hypothetical protein
MRIYRASATVCGVVLSAFVLLGGLAQAQPATGSASGQWTVTNASGDALTARMKLDQEGQVVVGTWPSGSLHGNINATNPHQVDAKWNGPRGDGWATLIFSDDWKSFSGEWGFPGRKATGNFVAKRFYQSYPPVSHLWSVNRTGGEAFTTGNVKLQQTGTTVVGSYGNDGQITGSFSAPGVNEMKGTWKDPRGSGWIDLTFDADSKSASGVWGMRGSSNPSGSLVAAVNTIVTPSTAGLWQITFTGQDVHNVKVRFEQRGQSILGKWDDGHFTGTLPQGTYTMKGQWQTKAGSGPLTLTFDSSGNSVTGEWGYPGKPRGRVFGNRVP